MVRVSKQIDYTLQLLFALANQKPNQSISLRHISNESSISFLFLQKIAKSLKDASMIEAVRGPQGGYRLIRKPEELTLKEIVEAVEGPFGVTECFKHTVPCKLEKTCQSRKALHSFNAHILDYLHKTTLAELQAHALQYI
jgi:Rrf2 family protein